MHIIAYLRLGMRGVCLDPTVFQQQRESPQGVKHGFFLVLTVGVLVGGATAIGQWLEGWVSYRQDEVVKVIHQGITQMPWYVNLSDMPGFTAAFERHFAQWVRIVQLIGLENRLGALFTPVQYLLTWVVFGSLVHLIARRMGGRGSLSQTLACLSLASGAHLLAVVDIIPFAQVSATALLALLITYLAIREAHRLHPWGAFWTTMLSSLLLALLAGLVGLAVAGAMVMELAAAP